MKGPWTISEDDARKRDEAVRQQTIDHVVNVVARCCVKGMSDDHITFILAKHGIRTRDLCLAQSKLLETGVAANL